MHLPDPGLGMGGGRGLYLWLFPGGGGTSLFPRVVCGLAASYCQSLMTPESVYVAVSSARVKIQDGREGRKKNKNKKRERRKTEDRAKLTTEGEKGCVEWSEQANRG